MPNPVFERPRFCCPSHKELGMDFDDDDKTSLQQLNSAPSVERYLNMDDKEKDLEIQKAVFRLQKRINEILYLMESEATPRENARRND